MAAKVQTEIGFKDVTNAGPEVKIRPEIYEVFVKTALGVVLTVGCTLGAIALAAMAFGGTSWSVWPAVTEAHGLAQIMGWVGLFVMGVAYQVLPRVKATTLRGRRLAVGSYWLILASVVLRMVGQPLASLPAMDSLVLLGAVAGVLGASLFAAVSLATLASNRQAADFYDKYIVASACWFWVWTVATLALVFYHPDGAAGQAIHSASLHLALMGFAAMMIFAFTLRTLPAFIGLRPLNKAAYGVIFWGLNLGMGVQVGGSIWAAFAPSSVAGTLTVLGAAVEFAAIVSFVYCLGIFRKPIVDVGQAPAVLGAARFIKAAYLWLLVAASLGFGYVVYQAVGAGTIAHSLVGAYHHALTVGFISMMILGMASRLIPVFAGRPWHSQRLLLVSFVLLNLGNSARVLTQPLADFYGGAFFGVMGASGFLEVIALSLFTYNLLQTMSRKKMRSEN